jgi:hypothetical protein
MGKIRKQTSDKSIYLIIGFILIIVVSPAFLVLPSIAEYFDFSETGQIGDTIGGITAPFINLLGALLVYYSFREQIKANKIQMQALNHEIKSKREEAIYNSIVHDIDNFRADINDFRLFDSGEVGTNAIFKYQQEIERSSSGIIEQLISSPLFQNLYFLVGSTDDILTRINKADINDYDRRNLQKKLLYIYSSKISSKLLKILAKLQQEEISNPLIEMLEETEVKLRVFMNENKI